jgi:hypothetical protein
VGGEAGAATGLVTDTNNRQLHQKEKTRIEKLAGGDPKKEARLTAAACALVKCYAQYAEDSPEYRDLKRLADLGASDAYAAELRQLSSQPGFFGYSTDGVINDANRDALKALTNTYQVVTRGVGAGQMLFGAVGLGGILATAPASCATGIGCYASGMGAVLAADQVSTGAKQLVYGRPQETYLSQSLQTLGMSPEAAGWMEAALGTGSVAKAASVANKAIGQNGFVKVVGANTQTIATAQSGRLAELLPESSLSTRQAAIHAQLSEQGSFSTFSKRQVSMADLRDIGRVTGDEYNMFTKGGERLIIRGEGSNIRVSEQMYDDLLNGQYGKFSGHTHPPGYSIEPGPADRPFLNQMQQGRSAIWGDNGYQIFGPVGPADDARILSEINRARMQKLYGNQ